MIRVTLSALSEIVDGEIHIRTYGSDPPRWNGTVPPIAIISPVLRGGIFFQRLIDPPIMHAVLTSRSYSGQSVRDEIFLQRDLDSLLLPTGKSTVCTCVRESQERRRYTNAVVMRDGYSPPKVWHVSGGAQVSALTAGRTLENDIAGRVITGRRVLSRGQHPENKREFTVSVSFWHGPP